MCPHLPAVLLAAAIAPLLAWPALAQEDGGGDAGSATRERPKTALERSEEIEATEISPQELLTSALQGLRRTQPTFVRAQVKHKQPEAAAAQPGAPGQPVQIIVRAQGPGMEQDPFEGTVEAWRDANGAVVLVSEEEIPGFGLYIRGERTIRRLTFEGSAPGLDQLQAELLSLLDGERVAPHLSAATLAHRRDEATGDHIFTGSVSRDVVRPMRSVATDPVVAAVMAARMLPRVLRADVELRLSKDGTIKRCRYTVVHNDPAREMMQGAFAGRVVIRGGAGGPIPVPQPNDGNDKEKHDIEGTSTVYTLDLTATEPSERAKAFKRDIQRVISE